MDKARLRALTVFLNLCYSLFAVVEMDKARLRALTDFLNIELITKLTIVEMDKARLRALTVCHDRFLLKFFIGRNG